MTNATFYYGLQVIRVVSLLTRVLCKIRVDSSLRSSCLTVNLIISRFEEIFFILEYLHSRIRMLNNIINSRISFLWSCFYSRWCFWGIFGSLKLISSGKVDLFSLGWQREKVLRNKTRSSRVWVVQWAGYPIT